MTNQPDIIPGIRKKRKCPECEGKGGHWTGSVTYADTWFEKCTHCTDGWQIEPVTVEEWEWIKQGGVKYLPPGEESDNFVDYLNQTTIPDDKGYWVVVKSEKEEG